MKRVYGNKEGMSSLVEHRTLNPGVAGSSLGKEEKPSPEMAREFESRRAHHPLSHIFYINFKEFLECVFIFFYKQSLQSICVSPVICL